MMKVKRIAAVAACLALAVGGASACGGQKGDDDKKNDGVAVGKDTDLSKFMNINEKPVEELEDGGILQLAVSGLGPNFNTKSNAGNSLDTSMIVGALNYTGCWSGKPDGTYKINKDFCEDATEEVKDNKQVLTYKLKKDIKFNDGTPFDYKVFENHWKIMTDPKSDVVSRTGYEDIESVAKGADDFEVVVTTKKITEPWRELFGGLMSTNLKPGEPFNKGFVDKVHDEWMSGPFKVEKYDKAAKQMVLAPNEKWHGAKAKLGKIVFKAMESNATIAAVKNGELDATAVSTAPRLNQVKGDSNFDIRRGLRTSTSGYLFNSRNGAVKDKAVRKAIWQAVDLPQLREIRYKGLDWTDPAPGSWVLSPISPYYQDNRPVKERDLEGAKKTLEDAGYKAGADGKRSKDGKPLVVKLTTFGDDPTFAALAQAFQKHINESGIQLDIDNRPSSAFNDVMDKQQFELVAMGYTLGGDATGAAKQFFHSKDKSNMTGVGSAEIDKGLEGLTSITDDEERNAKANELEKAFMEEFAMMPSMTGPIITAYRKGLANFGPNLFLTYFPEWEKIGWEKGSKHK